MAIDLRGKPIAISGASSGIGRATALACARAGMPVLVSARREDRLRALVDEVRAAGGEAALCAADVGEEGSGERIVEACARELGPPYAVFANAGFGYEAALHESTDERLREIFEVNLFGSLRLVRAALPGMVERGSGHALWCSSCLGILPVPRYGAYCATKAAQHHLARAMRVELRGAGVHATSVHPIGTKTEFFDEADRRSGGATLFDKSAERFMQPPERVARAVVKSLRRPRAEAWTSVSSMVSMRLMGLSPGLTDALTGWAMRSRRRKAAERSA